MRLAAKLSSKPPLVAASASLVWKSFGANSNDFPAQFDAYRALSNVMHALLGDVSLVILYLSGGF
jgi:hypothetical protein